ncbi:MAG: TrmH family RNA methyltransferase [Muribaculaceae bacterium]|nr:TrmH family RNA methyltransferase [Muribaculaceae bacterium]
MSKEKKSILELTRTTTAEYKETPKLPVAVMTDNLRSAQNIGAIFRTSDALLIKEIILAGISPVPPSKEISKTALGAEQSVAWRYVKDPVEEVKRLQHLGKKIIVLEQTHDSIMLQDFRIKDDEEYVLVVGNEVSGVDQKIVDLADYIIEIPMHGIKHSFNVAVSTGITLWQLYTLFTKC